MRYNIDNGTATMYHTTIEKLMLFGTRHRYHIPYIRNFDISVTNHNTLEEFERIIRPNHNIRGSNYSPRKLSATNCTGVLSDMVNISAMPVGAAEIDNGWENERFRFIMVVRNVMGSFTTVSYIQGYTDYTDTSYSGLIDPNSRFYINSITVVSEMVDPITNMVRSNIIGTFNVIAAGGNVYYENADTRKLIRPKDVIFEQSILGNYGGGLVNNTTNIIDGIAKPSTRANNNPVEYLTRTINSFIDGYNNSLNSYDPSDTFRNAEAIADEYDIHNNPFIRELYKLEGGLTSHFFTYQTLVRMDATIPTRTNMFLKDMDPAPQHATLFDTEHTEQMLQPTEENLKAAYIASSVSSILTSQLMTRIVFSMTNMGGSTELYILDANSMLDGVIIEHCIGKIESRLKHILESKLVDMPGMVYDIHVSCDVFSDTVVAISLNGQQQIIYRYPSFADSLYSPMITNRQGAEVITTEVGNLFDVIGLPGGNPVDNVI